MSRTKGHSWERDCAIEFRKLGWIDARRHLEYQDGEAYGVDLANTEPFIVQCKRGAKYASITALEEIQPKSMTYTPPVSDIEEDDGIETIKPSSTKLIPLLLTKGDHKKEVAVLYWEDLKEIISGAYSI